MLSKIVVSLFCVYLCVCPSLAPASQARLHLFMIGDINPAELVLQSATSKDLAAIRRQAQMIAQQIEFKFVEKSYLGFSVQAKHVVSDFKNLAVSSKDIVFFYFSGHGFTTPKQKNDPWPNLSFSGDQKAVPLSHIIKITRELKPRFAVILADCCNTIIGDELAPVLFKSAKALPLRSTAANYKKMFLERKGCIVIAGAKKSEPSLATQAGSFCTYSFLKSLHEKVQGPTELLNWQGLLDLTNYYLHLKAQEYSRYQNLIYSIDFLPN